ncbi:MAG: hypothetical protein M3N31_05035 [Actinomycetota bacterium]|nr:hypothetical protein [Actinomycetota bacterium]
MAHQDALTIVADIRPGRVDELRQLLEAMGEDAGRNDVLPFAALSGVHFARLLIVDEATDLEGRSIPARLVYICDVDAPLERHLAELVDVTGDGVDRIFGQCEGYPVDSPLMRERRLLYLKARRVSIPARYVNTIGRTVQQVHQEARLREGLQGFLDSRDWEGQPPSAIHTAVRQFVAQDPKLNWARWPADRPDPKWRLRNRAHQVGVPLLLLPVLPLALAGLPLYLAVLWMHERRDEAAPPGSGPRDPELTAMEDLAAQNPFSAVGILKPGPFRLYTTMAMLKIVNYAARHIYNQGSLTGVKSLHFARWVFLDGKRRILFASNYDGSLENYMDDFIDKIAWGLNAIFSNGMGYPPTRWLVFGGANYELEFKAFLYRYKVATPVWYSAYPELTALNIANNARVRKGLARERMSPRRTEQWLSWL